MTNQKVHRLALISLLTAIVMIQTFIPWLGYFPIGPIHITLVQVTVILAGALFGVRTGSTLGLIWGTLAWMRHLIQPTIMSPVFIHPLVSILPRLLVGFLSAWIAGQLVKRFSWRTSLCLTGLLGSALNTLLVLGAIALFAKQHYAHALGIDTQGVGHVLWGIVLSNGLLEMIVSAILVPLIGIPLRKAVK